MFNIEKIEKFLKTWKQQPGYVGALLAGSHAVGTADEFSDVDIHIVFSDEIDWRERGNLIVNGTLFEYFANPIKQYRSYMRQEFALNKNHTARMFTTGKLLEDLSGEVARLKMEGTEYLAKNIQGPDSTKIELLKYEIWETLDGLKSVETTPSFSYLYALTLKGIVDAYFDFLEVEKISSSKFYRYLTDERFAEKYKIKKFPDTEFKKIFIEALTQPSITAIEKVASYVQLKMGGFDIDGWKLRTKVSL